MTYPIGRPINSSFRQQQLAPPIPVKKTNWEQSPTSFTCYLPSYASESPPFEFILKLVTEGEFKVALNEAGKKNNNIPSIAFENLTYPYELIPDQTALQTIALKYYRKYEILIRETTVSQLSELLKELESTITGSQFIGILVTGESKSARFQLVIPIVYYKGKNQKSGFIIREFLIASSEGNNNETYNEVYSIIKSFNKGKKIYSTTRFRQWNIRVTGVGAALFLKRALLALKNEKNVGLENYLNAHAILKKDKDNEYLIHHLPAAFDAADQISNKMTEKIDQTIDPRDNCKKSKKHLAPRTICQLRKDHTEKELCLYTLIILNFNPQTNVKLPDNVEIEPGEKKTILKITHIRTSNTHITTASRRLAKWMETWTPEELDFTVAPMMPLKASFEQPIILPSMPAPSQATEVLAPIIPKGPNIIAELPPVPKDGIKVGLPNITEEGKFGNVCWLNSLLKFISSCHHFDEMLVQEICSENNSFSSQDKNNAKIAQEKFRNMVKILRTGQIQVEKNPYQGLSGSSINNYYKTPSTLYGKSFIDAVRDRQPIECVPEDIYKEFLHALKLLKRPNGELVIPHGVGDIEEASQYLEAIAEAFEWRPFNKNTAVRESLAFEGKFPQFARVYTAIRNKEQYRKDPRLDCHCEGVIPLTLTSAHISARAINLGELVQSKEVLEGVRVDSSQDIKNKPLTMDWEATRHFVILPDTMIVSLRRLVIPTGANYNPGAFQEKVDSPIQTTDGLIAFTECIPVFENTKLVDYKPHKVCFYRIDAAVVHKGKARGGHYICEERTASMSMLFHSDKRVVPYSEAEFGVFGSILRLKKVKEQLIK